MNVIVFALAFFFIIVGIGGFVAYIYGYRIKFSWPYEDEKQEARNRKARATRARNTAIREQNARTQRKRQKARMVRRREREEVQQAEEAERAEKAEKAKEERRLQAAVMARAKEEERQRKAQIAALVAAAQEQAEAKERERLAEALVAWKQERVGKLASPDDVTGVVRMAGAVRSYYGRTLHLIALVSHEGTALEWKAEIQSPHTPTVVGYCDDHEMFTQHAFEGRHQALLAPGRHFLTFYVNTGSKAKEPDLSFEVHIPASTSRERWKKAIDETADEFVDAATTVNNAKAKVRKSLANQGSDPDEIDLHIARMEVKLQDLGEEQ